MRRGLFTCSTDDGSEAPGPSHGLHVGCSSAYHKRLLVSCGLLEGRMSIHMLAKFVLFGLYALAVIHQHLSFSGRWCHSVMVRSHAPLVVGAVIMLLIIDHAPCCSHALDQSFFCCSADAIATYCRTSPLLLVPGFEIFLPLATKAVIILGI